MKVSQIKILTGFSLSRIYQIISTLDTKHKYKTDRRWEIDNSILHQFFIRKRIPKEINKKSAITYSIGKDWTFIGNFNISRLSLNDNKLYSNLLFNHLPRNSEMIISYEKNLKDEYYHTHFLISTQQPLKELEGFLDTIVGQKDFGNRKDYFIETFDLKRRYGVFYSLKSTGQIEIKKK